MEYRKLGETGLEISAVALGTEYLIDLPRQHVVAVIREAIERGINYFDLFYAQPEFRDNMGAAFEGHREKVLLAAHLGRIWQNGQGDISRTPQESERFFLDFLSRYKTDHADVLFLHNCDEQDDYCKLTRPGGLLDLACRLKQEGKTRLIGFSGHTVKTALQAVENGSIDVLMFPVNISNHAIPDRKELLSACARYGVGLVAMKPYAGGKLLRENRPAPITPVQCLAYSLAQVGVSTVVPGCQDLEQLAAALAYHAASSEQRDYSAALADVREYVPGECVYCNHCLPCPAEIDIGQTVRLLETAEGSPTPELRAAYAALAANASDCEQCGACVDRCPFDVDVIAKMEEAAELFR